MAVVAVVWTARRARQDPARCPEGLVSSGPRCCAPGQAASADGSCQGVASSCPTWLVRSEAGACMAREARVPVAAGRLVLDPRDWEAEGIVARREALIAAFEIDAHEVTRARWQACAERGACEQIASGEPGAPVTDVSVGQADRYCRFAGGRLPTADEWVFVASGGGTRRYPWGQTGLVCRRAAFGLAAGPCAHSAQQPELAASRPDGRTPDGLLDLAGNVAEWSLDPDASFRAHGGSFRSRVAGELKAWATEAPGERAGHVGFRCVYPAATPPAPPGNSP